MRPKPDASTYYKQQHTIEAREIAEQKAKEAREQLRDKIGLGEVNKHEAKNNSKREHA